MNLSRIFFYFIYSIKLSAGRRKNLLLIFTLQKYKNDFIFHSKIKAAAAVSRYNFFYLIFYFILCIFMIFYAPIYFLIFCLPLRHRLEIFYFLPLLLLLLYGALHNFVLFLVDEFFSRFFAFFWVRLLITEWNSQQQKNHKLQRFLSGLLSTE